LMAARRPLIYSPERPTTFIAALSVPPIHAGAPFEC
jgi:hypothetical protein